MVISLDEMICRYVSRSEPYVTAHFDEIESSGWRGYQTTDVVALCRRYLAELRSKPPEIWCATTVAFINIPLEVVEKPPILGVVHGWDFLRCNWNTNEPPALYLLSSDDLGLESSMKENYTAPVVGLGVQIDAAYVRYVRDIEEVAAGDVYYGNAYLVAHLSLKRGNPSILGNFRLNQ